MFIDCHSLSVCSLILGGIGRGWVVQVWIFRTQKEKTRNGEGWAAAGLSQLGHGKGVKSTCCCCLRRVAKKSVRGAVKKKLLPAEGRKRACPCIRTQCTHSLPGGLAWMLGELRWAGLLGWVWFGARVGLLGGKTFGFGDNNKYYYHNHLRDQPVAGKEVGRMKMTAKEEPRRRLESAWQLVCISFSFFSPARFS